MNQDYDIQQEIHDNHLFLYLIGGQQANIDFIDTILRKLKNSMNKTIVVFKDYKLFEYFQEHNLIIILEKAPKLTLIVVLTDKVYQSEKIHFVKSIDEIRLEKYINSFEGQKMNKSGIPIILDAFLTYFTNNMHHEGIFRKCAVNTEVQTFHEEVLQYKFDSLASADPHLVACTFKQYFTQLPSPLINTDLVFLQEINILATLNSLSYVNARVLYVIISFFIELSKQEQHNKMNIKSLSMLVAPCLIRVPTDQNTLTNFTKSIGFVQKMMENFKDIAPGIDYNLYLDNFEFQEEEMSDEQLIQEWNRMK